MLAISLTGQMTLGDLVVGAATTVLAVVTVALAKFAYRSTQAAERGVIIALESTRVAQAGLDSIDAPFVIATPTPRDELVRSLRREHPQLGVEIPHAMHRAVVGDNPVLRLRLWNIGTGPTIVEDVLLVGRHGEQLSHGFPAHAPIAANQAHDVVMGTCSWQDGGIGELRILYTHANGSIYQTSSVIIFNGDVLACSTYMRTRENVIATGSLG